jgi:topoisomerase (DNA) II binding protein 1
LLADAHAVCHSFVFIAPDVQQRGQKAGAFARWRVVLCVDPSVRAGFKSLLEAGGATVVHVEFESMDSDVDFTDRRPPFTLLEGVTHAFVEAKVGKAMPAAILSLRENSIQCVKPEYIAEFLAQDPPPQVDEFAVSF